MSGGEPSRPPPPDAHPEALAALPPPEVYEEEYLYWPWGRLLDRAVAWITSRAPSGGLVLDYMCGTGYLLAHAHVARPDLTAVGCDISGPFVDYGRQRYPEIELVVGDALMYAPARRPDILACTAGLHHLPERRQPAFVEKVASELAPGGYLLLGEELLREHDGPRGRSAAVLEMWSALIDAATERGAPAPVLDAAAQALRNDLLRLGEYKLTRRALLALIEPHFRVEDAVQTWPNHQAFGDWLFICRRIG